MSPERKPQDPNEFASTGPARALTTSERRFEAVFDLATIGMVLLDREGRCTRVNETLCSMLGRSQEEIIGQELAEFADHDGSESAAALRDMITSFRDGQAFEGRFLHRSGRGILTRTQLAAVRDDDGNTVELIARIEDITQQTQGAKDVAEAALHDPLTGLLNRLLFVDRLTHALARSERMLGPVAVLFVNLDHFKSINEKYGHAQGDEVLKATAKTLQSVVRPSDTVARIGGDEFAVLCEDMKGETGAVVVAERLFTALREPIPLEPEPLLVSASIGIAFAQEGDDPDKLMRNADAAMFRVKEGGRGTYEIYLDAL